MTKPLLAAGAAEMSNKRKFAKSGQNHLNRVCESKECPCNYKNMINTVNNTGASNSLDVSPFRNSYGLVLTKSNDSLKRST